MASVGSVATGPVPTPEAEAAPAVALERALRAVGRRLRVQRALSGAASAAVAGFAAAAAAVVLVELGHESVARGGFALAALLPLAGAAAGALRRVDRLAAARLLDRDLGRSDLLASGWSFSQLPASERSEFMAACIRQAGAQALDADPRRALPLRVPRALGPAALLALVAVGLTWLDLSPEPPPAVVRAPKPRLLHHDDLRAFEEQVEPLLAGHAIDPLMGETARELNALLEALHEGEVDRAKALAELRALEKKLELSRTSEDLEALREALRGLGRTLDRDALTKSVAQAMADGDAAAARAELERLASALQEQPPRADALRKLGKTLERTAAPASEREDALKKARDELERLLKKQKKDGAQPDEREQRLLRDKRRELERLQREQQRQERAERKLDSLRRELSKASSPAQGNRAGETGQQLQRAAEQLAQAQREQLTAEQREQLRERLTQLRELISKQKSQQQQQRQAQRGGAGQRQGGQAQRLDLDRFVGLSRGQGDKPQDGQRGAEPGKPGGKLLMPGQGGEPDSTLLLPGQGDPSSQPGGEERLIADSRAGEGGRPESGEQTRLAGARVDTRVQGEQGQGPTRSEVIREAGQRGFVTRGYERVHTDYERHAEAVLERDRVPGGYRFYVRRYFQLIRPREGEP